jgi:hypothetical protein
VDVGLLLLVATSTTAVHLGGDGVRDIGQLLLLLLEVLSRGLARVLLKPIKRLLDSVEQLGTWLASNSGINGSG